MVCADEFSHRSTILTAHSLSLRIILISSTQDFSRQVSTGPDGSHISMTSRGVIFFLSRYRLRPGSRLPWAKMI